MMMRGGDMPKTTIIDVVLDPNHPLLAKCNINNKTFEVWKDFDSINTCTLIGKGRYTTIEKVKERLRDISHKEGIPIPYKNSWWIKRQRKLNQGDIKINKQSRPPDEARKKFTYMRDKTGLSYKG